MFGARRGGNVRKLGRRLNRLGLWQGSGRRLVLPDRRRGNALWNTQTRARRARHRIEFRAEPARGGVLLGERRGSDERRYVGDRRSELHRREQRIRRERKHRDGDRMDNERENRGLPASRAVAGVAPLGEELEIGVFRKWSYNSRCCFDAQNCRTTYGRQGQRRYQEF